MVRLGTEGRTLGTSGTLGPVGLLGTWGMLRILGMLGTLGAQETWGMPGTLRIPGTVGTLVRNLDDARNAGNRENARYAGNIRNAELSCISHNLLTKRLPGPFTPRTNPLQHGCVWNLVMVVASVYRWCKHFPE